jgi:ankyrin repeat protein
LVTINQIFNYSPPSQIGRPTKSLDLGFTELPEEIFMEFLREVSPRFTQETYNVLNHNCNNFTNECAQFLLGEGIPKDIVDLPMQFMNTPIGKMLSPMLL